jgi:hypothetical protein
LQNVSFLSPIVCCDAFSEFLSIPMMSILVI